MSKISYKKNWGRWGQEDERGTLNCINNDKVKGAAALVKRGQVYSLGLPIQRTGVPVHHMRNSSLHFVTRSGGDYMAGRSERDGFKYADDYVVMATHGTTHIDALAHAWYGDHIYNGFNSITIRSDGAQKCGIDKVRQIVTRGIMLDIAKLKNVSHLENSYHITTDDLIQALKKQGLELQRGDAVLIRTGWLKVFFDDGQNAYYGPEPGIGLEAAQFLADYDICVIGSDNYGIEVVPTDKNEDGLSSPVHLEYLRDRGIHIMEVLNLDELAANEADEFLFVCAPLIIKGGIGSPINPLAIV